MISNDIIQLINEINVQFTGDPKQDALIVANLRRKTQSQSGRNAIIAQQNLATQLQGKNKALVIQQQRELAKESRNARLNMLKKRTGYGVPLI